MADFLFQIDADTNEALKKIEALAAKLNDIFAKAKVNIGVNTDAVGKAVSSVKPPDLPVKPLIIENKDSSAASALKDQYDKAGAAAQRAMQQAKDEHGKFIKQVEGTKGIVEKAFAFNQISGAFNQLATNVQSISQPFIALDTATANLRTLGDEAAAMAPNLREAAIAMSKNLPFSAAEIQGTMFDALASGVKGGEEGLKAFADTAAKLATGGGSEIGEATQLLAGQLNAYGKSAEESARFADIFFNTVNYGVTSIPQLATKLANVVPTAASLDIELENVGAALAVMTSKGIPTAQSTTKLNQLFLELAKPAANLAPILKKAGVSLESLKQDDLPTTLEKVSKALASTGKAAVQVFSSSEAGAAFNTLTGDLEGFKKTFVDVRDTTGSAQFAYEQMGDSVEVKTKRMMSAVNAFIIQGLDKVGSGFVSLINTSTQLTPIISSLAGLKTIIPEGAVTSAVQSIKNIGPALGGVIGQVGGLSGAFTALWAVITGPVGLTIAAIAAVGAAFYLLYQNVEPFRNAVDATFAFLGDVFDAAMPVLRDIGDLFIELGGLVFDVILTPWKIIYEVVSSVAGAVVSLFNDGEESAVSFEGALNAVKAVFGIITTSVDVLRSSIAAIKATIAEVTAVAGEIATALAGGDIVGAITKFGEIGSRAGKAFQEGAAQSLEGSAIKNTFNKLTETEGLAVKIKANIDTANSLPQLTKQLDSVQTNISAIEVKVKAGTASSDDLKKLDELKTKAGDVSAKIADIAPNAVKGERIITNSTGNIIKVYDINSLKIAEVAEKQKELYGAQFTEKQKAFSNGIVGISDKYTEAKNKADALLKSANSALASGDKSGAAKLTEQYEQQRKKVGELGEQLKTSFESGSKAGLLTKEAADKVGLSLGIASGKGSEVADALKASQEAAEKAAAAAYDYAAAFDAAGKAANDSLGKSQQSAAGVQYTMSQLRKGAIDLAEINKREGTNFVTQKEALTALGKKRSEILQQARKERTESIAIDRIESNNNLAKIDEESIKRINNSKDVTKRVIEETRQRNELINKYTVQSEARRELELLKINQEANTKTAELEIKSAQDVLKIKSKTISVQERRSETIKIDTMISNKRQKEIEYQEKLIELEGKYALERFKIEQKQAQDAAKYRLETAQTGLAKLQSIRIPAPEFEPFRFTVDLINIDAVQAQSAKVQGAIGNAKLDVLKQQQKIELDAVIAQNSAVVEAQNALERAISQGNIFEQAAAKINLDLAKQAAAINDSAVLSAILKQQEAMKALAVETQNAITTAVIEAIEDRATRERALTLSNAQKTFDDQLTQAGNNHGKQLEAYQTFIDAKAEAEKKFARDSNIFVDLAYRIELNMHEVFTSEKAKIDEEALKKKFEDVDREQQYIESQQRRGLLSYKEYTEKTLELARQRAEAEKELGTQTTSFIGNLNRGLQLSLEKSFGDTAAKFAEMQGKIVLSYQSSASERMRVEKELESAKEKGVGNTKELEESLTKAIEAESQQRTELLMNVTTQMSAQMGALLADGKITLGEFVNVVIDAAAKLLTAQIPVWVASIFGTEVSKLGLAGIATAAALTGTLYALVGAAKASLGRKTGESRIGSNGTIDGQTATQTSDNIPRLLSKDEGIITAKANLATNKNGLANYQIIDIANKTGKSFDQILTERSPMSKAIERGERNNTFISNVVAFDVQRGEMGDRSATLKELRAIKAELAEVKQTVRSQKAQSVELSVEHSHEFDSDQLTRNIVKRTKSQLARL